jgi:hypothetical protein
VRSERTAVREHVGGDRDAHLRPAALRRLSRQRAHRGPRPPPDVAYANLVGVPARTVAGLARVAPGDPAGSLLWNLLAKGIGIPGADALRGIAMPIGGRLSADDVDAVRLWIAAGAPQDGVVPGTEAFLAPCPAEPPR